MNSISLKSQTYEQQQIFSELTNISLVFALWCWAQYGINLIGLKKKTNQPTKQTS